MMFHQRFAKIILLVSSIVFVAVLLLTPLAHQHEIFTEQVDCVSCIVESVLLNSTFFQDTGFKIYPVQITGSVFQPNITPPLQSLTMR